ncbi:type VI secretion system tip protein VgrG [Burkholderia thailandensis]|uniref:type VI secretion system Vgr family protein n=1 Tax=Burkholderia thailandensis TaxID=57975 RepID=UPI0003EC8A80|nr:type VI secretion system tip protein VgrG [Burkholderia thailandensis]AHI67603.1 Rhs element Vgr family protein [Burkholderia thailandensis H0587]AOJ53788.1 type IV secretion protein Rhs [Burkholderia thailandensis]AVR28074.1 type VI secretion system tip protein VgrG [Burkholderia thailandensis]MCZ2894685.1 type VI secretion system tip protein VgrG [Burkholderia thailandensis]TGB30573.1 type VI secretion system tip protein VgrG [Burkholderia thailandensis]
MNRVFTLDSPHGDDLKFHTLDGSDELGRLFEFRIEALADNHSLSLKDMLGKPVTVRIEQQDLSTRFLNGIVARASLSGRRAERYYGYELVVRPWLWLATRRSDCRIFQNKTVPEIVQEVLSTYGFPIENHLAESYVPRDYCVQYNETDAAFVSRLMEFEGIYFWFRHAEDTHTLMLGDAMSSHTVLPGYETIPYIARDRTAIADEEHIDGWLPAQEVSVGKHQTTDYDYTKPRADLSSQKVDPRGHDHDGFASFEWPGGYRDDAPGAHYSRVRLEEQQAEHERASADTDVRGAAPGYLFTLEHCPRADQNREYLIVRCQYRFQENAYASDPGAEAVVHQTMMLVQPSSLPYRSPRETPRPRTNGPQTATVVGPPGEEIWTDQYGRVKLQFRWDRYGQSNQDSSCWVRVSSPWAGGGFGGVQIPRVGDEVVVDFLNGDPDEPIVTGRVFNGEKMPPWGLPGSATQSGLLSRSSPGGTTDHANAFRFEDKKGAEQLWMHAERNFDAETEADHTLSVGHDHTSTVGNDETMQVKSNRQRSVGQDETVNIGRHRVAQIKGNETHGVEGDRTRTVGKKETVTIVSDREATIGGSHTETVTHGKTETIGDGKTLNVGQMYQTTSKDMKTLVASAHTEEIGTRTSTIAKAHTHTVGGEHTVNVGANHTTNVQHQVTVNAGDQLSLVCGMSSIVMKSDGTITIQGVNVASTGTNTHSVNGKTVTSSATAEHTVEGAILKLNP